MTNYNEQLKRDTTLGMIYTVGITLVLIGLMAALVISFLC